ncbi:MAG: hypothetical protein JXA69_08975 [Phycisphaerae bacterium]|nr:hypothetical protein [Phycisphaerae bacterium]
MTARQRTPMRRFLPAILPLLAWAPSFATGGADDLLSDTWVATDALGRTLPGHAECGLARSGRYVGVFYFLWLGAHGTGGPYDITELLAANPTDPAWGPLNAFHHWGQSELGYYLSDDEYVIRRHCHMLVDAGVDTIILDVTNGFAYTSNYMLLCSVYQQIRTEGGRTPQICFLANTNSDLVVQKLYNEFYSPGLYPDLWFRWLGKPLMLSKPDGLSATIRDFFTFRQSWAWSGTTWFGDGYDKWPWLDHYPQAYGWHTPGVPEEVPVCVAQHPVSNIGRSFHDGSQPPHDAYGLTGTEDQGLCFAEQAERALQIDPEFLFITGWNEWVAQRFISDGTQWFLGQPLPSGGTYFVDAYTQEYSRDIEPMLGGHTDNYYCQMIGLIRRFKGVRDLEPPSPSKTITIDGSFDDWTNVQPEYWDTTHDTTHRNHAGWGSAGTYVNTTGRNDFTRSKVTYDPDNIYFYAETGSSITSRNGANWMLLYIDADNNHDTGWEGYDYLVNSSVVNSTTTTLKRHTDGYNWSLVGNVSYRVSGNRLEVALPRTSLGLTGPDLVFDFHWADNIQQPGDIISFCIYGDSAPNRRFNYRFSTLAGPPAPVSDFATEPLSASRVTLRWTNPLTADFARTSIRVSTAGFPAEPADGTAVTDAAGVPGSTDSFVHEGLSPGIMYYYAAFTCDSDGYYSSGITSSTQLTLADIDGDSDVDLADFALFSICFNGPNRLPLWTFCGETDLDTDGDVDLVDFAAFSVCFNGPNRPAACE